MTNVLKNPELLQATVGMVAQTSKKSNGRLEANRRKSKAIQAEKREEGPRPKRALKRKGAAIDASGTLAESQPPKRKKKRRSISQKIKRNRKRTVAQSKNKTKKKSAAAAAAGDVSPVLLEKRASANCASGPRASIPKTEETQEVDYCHVHQSLTPNSTRTREARLNAIEHIKELSAKPSLQLKRDENRKKIASLRHLSPKECRRARLKKKDLEQLDDTDRLPFFCGTKRRRAPNLPDEYSNGRVLSSRRDLFRVDTTEGFHLDGVFTLIPRKVALEEYSHLEGGLISVCDALSFVERMAPQATKRSAKQRAVIMEDPSQHYITFGAYPNGKKQGVGTCMKGLDKDPRRHKIMGAYVKLLEKLAFEYMSFEQAAFIKSVRESLSIPGFNCGDGTESQIWPSMAFGRNVYLSCHTDEDYFLSLTSVIQEDGPATLNSPITHCFNFPDRGVSVALRSGDVLLFNPLVRHCVSSSVNPARSTFCLTLYLKTEVASGHSNGPVWRMEQKAAHAAEMKARRQEEKKKKLKRKAEMREEEKKKRQKTKPRC